MELHKTCIIALAGASLAGWAFAQDADDDSTINVITDPAAGLPDAVLDRIVIPEPNVPEASLQRSEEGALHSAEGQAIAAANREAAAAHAEVGLTRAQEAAANAAEAAVQALANAGPPDGLPAGPPNDLPAGPPDDLPLGPPEGLPAVPEDAGRPANLPTLPDLPAPAVGG
jgi:hypothetical protein